MSDHFNQLLDASLIALPWLAFLSGLAGSLHCVGMCGGLVAACTPNKKGIWLYQFGRLLGYSLLALFAGTIGHLISTQFQNTFLKLAPSLTLGFLFIFWGWNAIKGKKEVSSPRFLQKTYKTIWSSVLPSFGSEIKPFGVGFFSILLPCGLLYALILMVAAFQSPLKGLVAIFFFWLGTLPAMSIAPEVFQKIMAKFFGKSPKLIGTCFVLLGIITVSYRLFLSFQGGDAPSCH